MTAGQHISQEDLILYAMQALSEEELAAVRQHLHGCAVCRAELEEVQGDLAMVALSVEQHPVPEGARQRFMEKISATPSGQERPAQPPVVSIDRRPARKPALWISWAMAAVLAIVALLLSAKVERLNIELRNASALAARSAESNARAQEVVEILTAPRAQRALLTAVQSPAAPSGRAVYLASRGGLIFEGSHLAQLPENKTYELWVIPADGSAPIPAGLFRPNPAGEASLVLPQLSKAIPAKAFGVTIEKAEGSQTPTAPIILSGAPESHGF